MMWNEKQLEMLTALGIRPETLSLSAEPLPAMGKACTVELASDLLDAEFAILAPCLPPEPRQGGAVANKAVIDALLWADKNHKKLTQLPARYGTAEAVRKRAERWAVAGVWDRILDTLSRASISSSQADAIGKIARAHSRRGKSINDFRGR